jgi:prepilin-type N-terminal cleavage/methylation domain-containing protein
MRTRRDGFTVVEVLVALLVLSVAIIPMAGVMTQAARVQGQALSRAELTAMAESKFEEFRAAAVLGPSAALTTGGSVTSDLANKTDQVTSASGRNYRRRWLVASGPEGSITVTLRVLPSVSSRHELSHLEFTTRIYMGE